MTGYSDIQTDNICAVFEEQSGYIKKLRFMVQAEFGSKISQQVVPSLRRRLGNHQSYQSTTTDDSSCATLVSPPDGQLHAYIEAKTD